jgi:hypothetical protein
MRRRWVALICGVLAAATAQAGEFRAGAAGWRDELSGQVNDHGQVLDFRGDLDAQADGVRSLRLEYDTPGRWPNLSAAFAQLAADGHVHQDGPFIFGPIVIPNGTSSDVDTRAEFQDGEFLLRYPLQLGPLALSGGLAAKWLKGEVVITDTGNGTRNRQHYNLVFPELHAQLRWAGRWIGFDLVGQGIRYGGNRALEWRAALQVNALSPLTLEGGWQEKRYDVAAGDSSMDARLAGPWLGLGLTLPRRR